MDPPQKIFTSSGKFKKDLKAVVLGSSGAVGRELVQELLKSDRWSEVTVITRRVLENQKGNPKLKVIELDSLDKIDELDKNMFKNYNSVFIALGNKLLEGSRNVRKINYTYAIQGGIIAQNNKIPHVSYISAQFVSMKNIFQSLCPYFEAKGMTQQQLIENEALKSVAIWKPGFITNRVNEQNSSFIDKISKYFVVIPKVSTQQLAQAMRQEAEYYHDHEASFKDKQINIFENNQIKKYLENKALN